MSTASLVSCESNSHISGMSFFIMSSTCLIKKFHMLIRSEELVNYIAGMPSSPEIIRAMDEISDTVSLCFMV